MIDNISRPNTYVVFIEPMTVPPAKAKRPTGKGLRAIGALIAEDIDAARVKRERVDGRRVGIPTGARLTSEGDKAFTAHVVATRDARDGRDQTAAAMADRVRTARRTAVLTTVQPRTGTGYVPSVIRWLNRPTATDDTLHGAMLYRRAVNTTIVERLAARLNRSPLVFAPGPVIDESRALIDTTAARFRSDVQPMHVAYASAHRAGGRLAGVMAEYNRVRSATALREATEHATWLDRLSSRPPVEMSPAMARRLEALASTMMSVDEKPSDVSAVWAAVVARTFLPSFDVPADARPFFFWTRNVAARAASEAFVAVRGDHLRIETEHDDVMNLAREMSAVRMLELLADARATACDGTCGEATCAVDAARDDTCRMTIGGTDGVIGWHTMREVACGECAACLAHNTCRSKVERAIWLPVARIIGASVKGAARRIFPTDKRQGVEYFSAMAAHYGYDAADAMTSDVHDASETTAISPKTRQVMRTIAETLDVMGKSVTAGNGNWSTDAADVAALVYGYEPTPRGRRSARARIVADNASA